MTGELVEVQDEAIHSVRLQQIQVLDEDAGDWVIGLDMWGIGRVQINKKYRAEIEEIEDFQYIKFTRK